jgi:hypothetical protein
MGSIDGDKVVVRAPGWLVSHTVALQDLSKNSMTNQPVLTQQIDNSS